MQILSNIIEKIKSCLFKKSLRNSQTKSVVIQNAEIFLESARKCIHIAPNVSYVLATTALEEVGKSILLNLNIVEQLTGNQNPSSIQKHSDDHVKKLFWAIWTPMMGQQTITGKKLHEAMDIAKEIHSTRIKSQYSDEGTFPINAVSFKQALNLIELTNARIKIEKSYRHTDPNPDKIEKINWFLNVQSNPENGCLIFGNQSMKKLAELNDEYKWVCWLKEQFDKSEQENRKLVENELKREIDQFSEERIKWKMTVRLTSMSHSIREGELQDWNKTVTRINLKSGNKQKKELIVEFYFTDKHHIKTLWWSSLTAINHFLVALNVGTFGHFCWYMPRMTNNFYEKLEDLLTNSITKLEINPDNLIQWGNLSLNKEDLHRVLLCQVFISKCKETKIYDHYLTGLNFMAKSDVLISFEPNALEEFVKALQIFLEKYKNINKETFAQNPTSILDYMENDLKIDKEKLEKLVTWGLATQKVKEKIDPSDVAIIKIIIDILIFKEARKYTEKLK